MKTTIVVVVVLVNVIVINAAPVRQTCAELLANMTSARTYAYCNKTTNTSQESHSRLQHLYDVSDEVMDALYMLCKTYNEKVSIAYYKVRCSYKCMCNYIADLLN